MLVTEQEILELQNFVLQLNSGDGVVVVEGKRDFNALRKLGYDTFMLFVNTSLDTAIERDKMRERTLGPERVSKLWNAVQANMGKFQSYFGRDKFILIDNNKSFEDNKVILDKMFVEIGKLIDKKPTSRAANAWIKSQRPG